MDECVATPKRRGRPARRAELSTSVVYSYLTAPEKTALVERAASCALSVSDYVRKLIAADIAASAETPEPKHKRRRPRSVEIRGAVDGVEREQDWSEQ